MKKVITVIFIVLFIGAAVFFIADRVGADEDLTTIRVKISIGDPVTYDFKPVGSYYVAEDPSIEMDGSNWYRVSLSGNNVSLYLKDTDGNFNLLLTSSTISFIGRESDNHDINLIYMYNDHYNSTYAYAGNMMFYKDSGAYHIHAINTLNIDIYLFGVIGYEMSNSWPVEALKAQAVAARSYAVTHIGASTYYDVVDTTGSQVYKGYNHRLDRVLEAVWATRGQVVAFVDEPNRSNPDYKVRKSDIVCTFFSASNGGQMDIPQHVWNQSGDPQPWQKITDDPYDIANPSSREETVFFPADAASESEFPANGLKQIKDLAIPKLQEQGFDVSSTGDFIVLGVTDMYTADGQVTVSSTGRITEDHRKIFPNQPAVCIDCIGGYTTVSVVASKTVNGQSVQEETSVQIKLDLDEFDDLSSPYNIFEQTSLRVTVAEPVMNGDTLEGYNLIQRRYGHGLGLSQRGAQTMAKEGFTYDEIILFYYPNTELWNLAGGSQTEPTEDPGPTPTPSYNATVNCNTYLNVRLGPGTSYAVIGQLYPEDRVIVITPYAASAWHKIFFNETYAYAHKDYIILDSEAPATPTPSPTPSASPGETTSPTPTPSATVSPTPSPSPSPSPSAGALPFTAKGKVTCSSLNVRNGASTGYTIVGRVYRDDIVYIIEKNAESSWHLIHYGNTTRYVYGGYISITSETDGYVYYDNGSYTETVPGDDPGGDDDPDDGGDTGDNTVMATVTASSLNIRSGPSTNYSIVGVIPRGGEIEIRDYGTGWSKIKYGGISGYVSSKYFVITSETNPTGDTATCIASSLRIRKGPGTSYTQIGSIPYNAVVDVLSYDTSWSKVLYGGVTGYSNTTYLRMND